MNTTPFLHYCLVRFSLVWHNLQPYLHSLDLGLKQGFLEGEGDAIAQGEVMPNPCQGSVPGKDRGFPLVCSKLLCLVD